jgi:hypothetical protein
MPFSVTPKGVISKCLRGNTGANYVNHHDACAVKDLLHHGPNHCRGASEVRLLLFEHEDLRLVVDNVIESLATLRIKRVFLDPLEREGLR